jgi:hypothetical protein
VDIDFLLLYYTITILILIKETHMKNLFKRKKSRPAHESSSKPASPQPAVSQQEQDASWVQSFLSALYGAMPSSSPTSDIDDADTADSQSEGTGWDILNFLKTAASFADKSLKQGKTEVASWYTSMKNYLLGFFISIFKAIANFAARIHSWTQDFDVNYRAFQADYASAKTFANIFMPKPHVAAEQDAAASSQSKPDENFSFLGKLGANLFS